MDWTVFEVDQIVADYMAMLCDEISGIKVNKTQHRRKLLLSINNRNAGSIEFKHQNISAVLSKLGLPFINGYKPKYNFQGLLADRILIFLVNNKNILEPKFQAFADAVLATPGTTVDFENLLEEPPKRQTALEANIDFHDGPFKINYLEREQKNISLGEFGEKLALEFEMWQLRRHEKDSLADKVEWIAKGDDSAGFDILSKHIDGTDKYIEVKTTKLNKNAPFFFSKREDEVSKRFRRRYYLYRIFNYSKTAKLFMLNGSFDDFCQKEAIQFKGLV